VLIFLTRTLFQLTQSLKSLHGLTLVVHTSMIGLEDESLLCRTSPFDPVQSKFVATLGSFGFGYSFSLMLWFDHCFVADYIVIA